MKRLLLLPLFLCGFAFAQVSPGFTPGLSTQPVNRGGTGATTAAGARSNLGVTATASDTTYNYRANNLSDVADAATAFGNIKQAATTSASGVVELATNTEAAIGTDTARAVSPAAMKAGLADEISSRSQMQGVIMTGAALLSETRNLGAFGTNGFSICAWAQLDKIPSSQAVICDGDNAFQFRITAQLAVSVYDRVGGTNVVLTDNNTIEIGHRYHICYARGQLYIDGKAFGAPNTDSSNYSGPITSIGTPFVAAESFPGFLRVEIFNRTFTASDVVSHNKHGVDSLEINRHMLIADSGYLNTSPWSVFGGSLATTTNTATALAGTFTNEAYAWATNTRTSLRIELRYLRYRLSYTVNSFSGNALSFSGNGGLAGASLPYTVGNHVVEIPGGEDPSQWWWISMSASGAGSIDISNIKFEPVGAVLFPEPNAPGNGLIWNDVSGNGAHIVLPTSNINWAKPSNAANRIRGTTSTNGNEALLGATTVTSNINFLRIRARSRTGTPSVKLGTSSGAGDIVNTVALSTAWKTLPLLYTDGTTGNINLMVNSNSTDVVEWDITFEPLNF